MSWEQRNEYFCKAQTDMQMIYIEAEREVKQLKAENAKLRKLAAKYSAAAKYLCGHSRCNECNLDCASVFGDVPSGWDCARALLDKEARELGIEVDE